MNNKVVIKSNKFGITVVLDKDTEYEELKNIVRDKFQQSSKFFGETDVVLAFEGKILTTEQQHEILNTISEVTAVNVICIVDNNEELEAKYEKVMNDAKNSPVSQLFYKGTLRSGQVLETENSIIVLGDVNPGGKIISKGNVVVLGSLRGTVYAGAGGNEHAFVVALEMNPMQVKIADVIARSSDSAPIRKNKAVMPKIAYVYEGNIYVEDLNQDNLEDIKLD